MAVNASRCAIEHTAADHNDAIVFVCSVWGHHMAKIQRIVQSVTPHYLAVAMLLLLIMSRL